MPPPTTDQTWPPASPAQLASSLLTSFQRMTSSARLLLIGCFQCEFLKAGCWRRQEEHDGAWFDSDKLQVEHPYCYVNPVALSDSTTATTLYHAPPSQHATQLPPHPTRPGSPLKASPQRPPGSALAPRGFGIQPGAPSPKRHKKPNINGGVVSESESQYDESSSTVESQFKDSVGLKDGVARYVRGQGGRTSLVESFAAKLEADLRRLEYDSQRAEGEIVSLALSPGEDDWPKEFSSTLGRSADFLLDAPSNDDLEDPPRLHPEVWKPSELENAFECYNMAAFYSYGASCQVGEKFASRVRGEKFEEVFPVSPRSSSSNNNNNNNNNNNKNNINNNNSHTKVIKATSDSESSSPRGVAASEQQQLGTENVPEAAGSGAEHDCSQRQLQQLIHACVLAESVTEVDEKCLLSGRGSRRNWHGIINFGGKSFNKLLIFNLVKSTMSECAVQYPRSMSLCSTYPVHLVQSKVIKVMLDEDKDEENLCGLQVFHSPSLSTQRERHLARRLVVRVATAEVKAEDLQWQDFKKEEQEMKEAIVNEVLHDLISDTTDVFKSLLAKKLSVSQKPKATDEEALTEI